MDRWENFRTLDLGDWHNIERRIGTRVAADGVAVRWVPSTGEIDLRDDAILGHLVEVSVTGAAVDVAGELPIEVSDQASLRFGDTDSTVTVRHETPGEDGTTRYGVEWVKLEDPLRQVVYGFVAEARGVTA
jgi:hypothetical protein